MLGFFPVKKRKGVPLGECFPSWEACASWNLSFSFSFLKGKFPFRGVVGFSKAQTLLFKSGKVQELANCTLSCSAVWQSITIQNVFLLRWLGITWSQLEIRNVGRHSSANKSESSLKQDLKMIHVHNKVWEALAQVVCFREMTMRRGCWRLCWESAFCLPGPSQDVQPCHSKTHYRSWMKPPNKAASQDHQALTQ